MSFSWKVNNCVNSTAISDRNKFDFPQETKMNCYPLKPSTM
jgi:hypothetical protein